MQLDDCHVHVCMMLRIIGLFVLPCMYLGSRTVATEVDHYSLSILVKSFFARLGSACDALLNRGIGSTFVVWPTSVSAQRRTELVSFRAKPEGAGAATALAVRCGPNDASRHFFRTAPRLGAEAHHPP